jgi:L,D-transpeptidase catalytic domain
MDTFPFFRFSCNSRLINVMKLGLRTALAGVTDGTRGGSMQWLDSMNKAGTPGKSCKAKRLLIIAALSFAVVQAAAADISLAPAALPSLRKRGATKRELVVSLPDRELAVIEDNDVVKIYSVAVGAPDTPSPDGRFEIVNRVTNPTYYHKGVVIGPGIANPLGNRWIGLSLKGYGIHGTNIPSSIGHAASHGCIRMRKRDVQELFSRVRVGDVVEIHQEPSATLAAIFHPKLAARITSRCAIGITPLPISVVAAVAANF